MADPAPKQPKEVALYAPDPVCRAAACRLGSRAACVAKQINGTSQANTLVTPISFYFLDCGYWGGVGKSAQRNFGLVCGRWAAVCDFVPRAGSTPTLPGKDNPLNGALKALSSGASSVKVMAAGYVGSPLMREASGEQTLYVCLPDLHLPVTRGLPKDGQTKGDGLNLGRWDYTGRGVYEGTGEYEYLPEPGLGGHPIEAKRYVEPDASGMVTRKDGSRSLSPGAVDWFDRYARNDIFLQPRVTKNRGSEADADLCLFLGRLAEVGKQRPVHLVQVGDLFDLWIGFHRYFAAPKSGVELGLPAEGTHAAPKGWGRQVDPKVFVDEWIKRTKAAFPRLFEAMANAPCQKTWLYGNHDNYLAAYVPASLGGSRPASLSQPGVFAEHGHKEDKDNRDGVSSGHRITNLLFGHPTIARPARWLESKVYAPFFDTRPALYRERAKRLFLEAPGGSSEKSHEFDVYVMAHTHSPDLLKIVVLPESLRPPPRPMYRGR